MTVFRVTPALSNQTTGYGTPAFEQASATEHSLIVETGAYLRAEGTNARAVHLQGGGIWKVNIDGDIKSLKDDGLLLNTGIQGLSEIVVGATGKVTGAVDGISALSSVSITNNGFIEGGIAGIAVDNLGQNLIVNNGSIKGAYSFYGIRQASDDTIENAGTMTGQLRLGGGDDRVENSGVVNGNLATDRLDLGLGNDTVVNMGEIALPVIDAAGDDQVSNGGVIKGFIDLGIGADVFTNLSNVDGRVTNGAVVGEIRLGDGDDRLIGGKFIEDYRDDGGADVIAFAAGNDVVRARVSAGIDGIDRISGGKGIDTYDAGGSVAGVYVNIDSVQHRLPAESGHLEIKAGTALGGEVAGTKYDRITGFENIFTGDGNDVVYGSSKGNYISGAGGNDDLMGLGGDDYLIGGAGADRLTGGIGYEVLEGGADADLFIFNSSKDSAVGAGRDVILDFQDGIDRIEISGIDAVKGRGDDSFVFIGMGAKFSGEAGELRTFKAGNGHVIEGDIDGDRKADFSIGVVDMTKAFVFTGDDFIL